PVGIPIGMMVGAIGVSGVAGVLSLSREAGVAPIRVLFWYAPWALRVGVVGGSVAVATFLLPVDRVQVAVALLLLGGLGYALLSQSLLTREPVRTYWVRAIAAVRQKLGRSSLR